jgi:hypothetical protein
MIGLERELQIGETTGFFRAGFICAELNAGFYQRAWKEEKRSQTTKANPPTASSYPRGRLHRV